MPEISTKGSSKELSLETRDSVLLDRVFFSSLREFKYSDKVSTIWSTKESWDSFVDESSSRKISFSLGVPCEISGCVPSDISTGVSKNLLKVSNTESTRDSLNSLMDSSLRKGVFISLV